mgnify:CR=1 FL=1
MLSLVALLSVSHFDVWSPPSLEGNWADEPASFGPAEYRLNAEVMLARACPCDWLSAPMPAGNTHHH